MAQPPKQQPKQLKRVGLYRLMRAIGSGATSEVFQAYKQGDHQKYAIKMIRLNKLKENQKQMISKQVNLIKSISHPHVVKLRDSLETANNYYLVFEFCEKGDLQKYLKKHYGPLIPQDAVQNIIFCIGDAVKQIHSKGIVHRDIKLANILLKKEHNNLVIKLADFGFAKQVNQEEFMMKTYCGTPITMAPQILLNEYYDKKCDIWSLGVILFQLVYGKLPFSTDQGYTKFVERVTKEPLKIPSQPQMPQQFKDLLQKCLQKKPQKRYSIDEFMNSEWLLQGKEKKLEERKEQVEANLSNKMKIEPEDQNEQQIQEEKKEKILLIQINTAEKLYKILKTEIQKIIDNHLDSREQIFQKIQKTISIETSVFVQSQYEKLLKLLYFLDLKYLTFLQSLKINISKETSHAEIQLEHIKNLQLPSFLYTLKGKGESLMPPANMKFGETIANFLKNLTEIQTDTLQKRRQRFQLVERFLSMFRRYELNVDIIFVHFYHRQQISLQNVIKSFQQMGKHISESLIEETQKDEKEENKMQEQVENQGTKYDGLSNFITISMECKQKEEKLKQFRQNLKQTCNKAIDEISKAIQGYY